MGSLSTLTQKIAARHGARGQGLAAIAKTVVSDLSSLTDNSANTEAP